MSGEGPAETPQSQAAREIAHYKALAQKAGAARLKETEALSRMIQLRQKAEAELQLAHEKLEDRVRERTAQLSESEARYRAMFENAAQAVMLVQEGSVIQVNPAFMNLFGHDDYTKVVGHAGLSLVHPDDRRMLRQLALRPENRLDPLPIRGLNNHGGLLQLEISFSDITIGGEAALLATLVDVTERERLEAEANALEEQRQHFEKMEAIGTLAGGVAHDLNNVLSAIISYPELMLLDLPPDSQMADDLRKIQTSGEKAAAIVKDMLALARRSVLSLEPLQLNTVIHSYLNSLEFHDLQRRHPTILFEPQLAEMLPPIPGSSVHLSKALMNLVTNAVEAMPNEGGKVRICTRLVDIQSATTHPLPLQAGPHVELSVSDNGTGIAAEDIGRIFEPFFTKKQMGRSGTGLGMAVVWGTVADHHGGIDVDSQEGVGTTMKILLPATSQSVAKPSATAENLPTGEGQLIMVVDDDEGQRSLIAALLKRLNYSALTVASGEEALELLASAEVSLMLIDMIMEPGIDGLETLKRAQNIRAETAAIMMSGYAMTEMVEQALELGAHHFLQKPYGLNELATVLHKSFQTVS